MNTALVSVIERYSASGFYVGAKIPQKKLNNALENYPVLPGDTALALIDATVFGSAKVGMLFGLRGIYWKNDWTTETIKNFLAWGELAGQDIEAQGSKITLAPGCVFDMAGASMKSRQLAALLHEILALAPVEASVGIQVTNLALQPSPAEKPGPDKYANQGNRISDQLPAQVPHLTPEDRIAKAGNELELAIIRFKTIFRLMDHDKARPIAEYAMSYFEALHQTIRSGGDLARIKRESDLIFQLSDHFIEVSQERETLRPELLVIGPDDSDFIRILRSLLIAKQAVLQEKSHGAKVDDFMKW